MYGRYGFRTVAGAPDSKGNKGGNRVSWGLPVFGVVCKCVLKVLVRFQWWGCISREAKHLVVTMGSSMRDVSAVQAIGSKKEQNGRG